MTRIRKNINLDAWGACLLCCLFWDDLSFCDRHLSDLTRGSPLVLQRLWGPAHWLPRTLFPCLWLPVFGSSEQTPWKYIWWWLKWLKYIYMQIKEPQNEFNIWCMAFGSLYSHVMKWKHSGKCLQYIWTTSSPFPNYYIKQRGSVLPWVCTVIDHGGCQNVGRTSVTHSAAPRVPLWSIAKQKHSNSKSIY